MSNTATRISLAGARGLADELVSLLSPVCERIEIAGSIRRERPDIGDVEIVAIPKVIPQFAAVDMFGAGYDSVMTNMLDEMCAGLILRGIFQYRLNKDGRKAWGTDLKWGLFRDFGIDLYSATAATWGATLAIRTGSAEFSHRLVTPRAQGGLCPSSLEVKGWRVRRRDTREPIDTPTEESVFETMGMLCPEPWQRTDTYQPVRLNHA